MIRLKTPFALGAALALAAFAPVAAQEGESSPAGMHYEVEGTIDGAMLVGGVGGEVYGGAWSEKLKITGKGSINEVTAQCVGMDQVGETVFDRHFTCTMKDGDGQSGAVLYGCTVTEGKTNEMRCYGHFEGKEGAVKDHASLMTAYYWFMPDGKGKIIGSGQWYK